MGEADGRCVIRGVVHFSSRRCIVLVGEDSIVLVGEDGLQVVFFLILDSPKLIDLLAVIGIGIQQAPQALPQSFITHLTDPCFHLFVVYLSFLEVYPISELQSLQLESYGSHTE